MPRPPDPNHESARPTLDDMLAGFDPELHGGEFFHGPAVGKERFWEDAPSADGTPAPAQTLRSPPSAPAD